MRICSRRATTEVSSTSSPTVTRTPPISDESTVTEVLSVAAEALLEHLGQVGLLRRVERERADDVRLGHVAAVVDQRAELRRDLGQHGQAAVVDDDVRAGSSAWG